jgi:RNA polymerase sigma factor (sigma-70 family)
LDPESGSTAYPLGKLAVIAQGTGNQAMIAKAQLLHAYRPQLRAAVRRATVRRREEWNRHVSAADRQDAEQAAAVALLECIPRFDAARGTSLGTFARLPIIGAMRTALTEQPVWPSVDDLGADDVRDYGAQAALDTVDESDEYRAVRQFVASLPPRQQQLVQLMFWDELTQAEAARVLGITRQAANDLFDQVKAKGRVALAR